MRRGKAELLPNVSVVGGIKNTSPTCLATTQSSSHDRPLPKIFQRFLDLATIICYPQQQDSSVALTHS